MAKNNMASDEAGRAARPPARAREWRHGSDEWRDRWSDPHGRWVERDGRRRWLVHVDRGSTTVVVLVHGAGGRPEQWHGVLDRLRDGTDHSLAVVTLLGHARSDVHPHEDAYATDELVDDVAQDIEAVRPAGGGARVVLVGHSLGSAVALRLADRVDALVLVGSAADAPAGASSPLLRCCYCCLELLRPAIGWLMAGALYHASADRAMVARERAVTAQNPFVVVCGLGNHARWPTRAEEEAVRVPTLILHGREDAVVTPLAGARELERRVPGSRLVVFGSASHNVMMEEPDGVAREIRAFITRAAAGEGAGGGAPRPP